MTVVTSASLAAAGWRSVDVGGFTGHVGPFWMRGDNAERALGLIIGEQHCNNHLGTLHGGVVMTFADIALGAGVAAIMDDKRLNLATVSLQTQFVSVARIGEFISCTPEVIRKSRQLVFVRGLIQVGDKTIASAEGIWKLLDDR